MVNLLNQPDSEPISSPIDLRIIKKILHPIRQNILLAIDHEGRVGFNELKKQCKLPSGTLYHHLKQLEGLVEQDSEKKYFLTADGIQALNYLFQEPQEELSLEELAILRQKGEYKLLIKHLESVVLGIDQTWILIEAYIEFHNIEKVQYCLNILKENIHLPLDKALWLCYYGKINMMLGKGIESEKNLNEGFIIAKSLAIPLIQAKLAMELSEFNKKYGRFSEALEYAEKSVQFIKDLKEPLVYASVLHLKGMIYFDMGDYDEALKYHEQALSVRESLGNYQEIAKSLSKIAMIHKEKGLLVESLQYLKRSLEIYQGTGNNWAIAETINNVGHILRFLGNHTEALEYFEKALVLHKEMNNTEEIADSLHNIALIYYIIGNLPSALEYSNQALQLKEKENYPASIASTLDLKGNIYLNIGNFDLALSNVERALNLREKLGNRNDIAESLNSIGLIYYLQGNIIKALELYNKAFALSQETRNKAQYTISLTKIASIYYEHGNYDKALDLFDKALALGRLLNNSHLYAITLKSKALVYFDQGLLTKAKRSFEESFEILKDLNDLQQIAQLVFHLIRVNIKIRMTKDNSIYLESFPKPRHEVLVINAFWFMVQALIAEINEQWVTAGELWEKALATKGLDFSIQIICHEGIAESIFRRWKANPTDKNFIRLEATLTAWENLCKTNNLQASLCNYYLFKANQTMAEYRFDESKSYLNNCIKIALENDLSNHYKLAKEELEELESKLE